MSQTLRLLCTFAQQHIRKVSLEDCYDVQPENPWQLQRCLQKTWLPSALQTQRLAWAKRELETAHPAVWYFSNLIWFDPCSTTSPAGPKKAADFEQATRGTKGYISADARAYSRNLRRPKQWATQCSWGDRRIWWVLVMSRGRMAVEVMPEGWKDDAAGMGHFARRVPSILNLGSSAAKPKVLYSDRGPGMFVPRTGQATGSYAEGMEAAGLCLYIGADASAQPSDLADFLLHETAIACLKRNLNAAASPESKPWQETHKQFQKRVSRVVREANKKCEFRLLCCEYLTRLEELVTKKADRLKK